METAKKNTIKCKKCGKHIPYRNNEVYVNDEGKRCIMCDCGKIIILKRK